MGLKPVSLTYVAYETDGGMLAEFMAYSSLTPLVLAVMLPSFFLARRELQTGFFILGHLVNEVLNLILKYSIRQPRPPGSHKYGFGMPSSHAQFMFFFSTYLSFLLLFGYFRVGGKLFHGILGLSSLLVSLIVSYSRIYLQVHTVNQVLVGATIGTGLAICWAALFPFFTSKVFPKIENWKINQYLLLRDSSSIQDIFVQEYNQVMQLKKAKAK